MLNYSKEYRISLINKDFLSLAVTSQAPSPVLSVSKIRKGALLCLAPSIHEAYISI